MLRRPDLETLFLRYRERGDVRALARLVDRTGPELLRLASFLVGDPHLAEDLVQTTWLTALERAQAYEPGRPVLPWLTGILANRARHLRRQRARREAPAVGELDLAPGPEQAAEARELEESLQRRLGQLEPPYREVLFLHLVHGLSGPELAAALDRSPGTVRTQIARGLERLRASLPAGFAASGLAFVMPSRKALAALREAVLDAVPNSSVATSPTLWIAGGLTMKAITATLVALVAVVALWIAQDRGAVQPTPAEVEAATLEDLPESSGPDASGEGALSQEPASTRTALVGAPQAAESEAFEGGLVVRARYGEGGPPAAGALVSVAPRVRESELYERSARCDEEGLARFAELDAGTYSVRGAQGGQAQTVLAPDATTEVELVIPAGTRVEGLVVDPEGRPVAGAQVWVSSARGWVNEGRVVAESAADGRFVLENVELGRYLSAFAPAFKPAPLVTVEGAGDAFRARLELHGVGRALIGRVIGGDGQPLAGALVQVGWTQGPLRMQGMGPMQPTFRLRTDARGEFRADGIEDRFLETPVWARAAGYAVSQVDVDLSEPGDARVTVELARGGTVRGRAADADGRALPDVHVSAFQDAVEPPENVRFQGPNWARRETMTDARGEYVLTNVHAGVTRMEAEHERMRAVGEFELSEGGQREWGPVLRLGGEIRGIVTDARGASLVGWDVWANGGEGVRDPGSAVTDEAGGFAFEDCDDAGYELFTRKSPMHQGVASLAGVRPGGAEVRLVVPDEGLPSAWIAARVEGVDGRVVDEVHVSLHLLQDSRWTNGASETLGGEFEIGPLIPGAYEVHVSLDGGHPQRHLGVHEVGAGERLELGTQRFEESGVVLLGVLDEAGQRVPEGNFILRRDGDMWASFLELSRGEARSDPVQPGEYFLSPWGAEPVLLGTAVTVRAGEETAVSFTLPRGVRRTLRYPGVSAPKRLFTLRWFDAEGALCASQSSFFERVEEPYDAVVRLQPGSYTARMSLADGSSAEARFTIDDQDRVEEVLELAVPPGW